MMFLSRIDNKNDISLLTDFIKTVRKLLNISALFYVMCVALPLYAQNETVTDVDAPVADTAEGAVLDEQARLSDILELDIFRPTTPEFEIVEQDVDRHYFESIQKAIVSVKEELNSTLVALNSAKKKFDDLNTLKGYAYYRAISPMFVNYYKYITPSIRNQYYLARSDEVLRQVGIALDERKLLFPLLIEESQVKSLVNEYRSLSGMISMLRGGRQNLHKAAQSFEYVLGENDEKLEYFSDEKEKVNIYNYLVGVNGELYEVYKNNNFILAIKHLRKKLYYLWNLISIRNANNEKLRDAKLQIIFDRYGSIMDTTGSNYNNLYKPFRATALGRVKDVETELGIGQEVGAAAADQPAADQSAAAPAAAEQPPAQQ